MCECFAHAHMCLFVLHPLCFIIHMIDRQEALNADLAQVQEEYANSKDSSRKTIQVSSVITACSITSYINNSYI